MEAPPGQPRQPGEAQTLQGRPLALPRKLEGGVAVSIEEGVASALALPGEDQALRVGVQEAIGKTLVRRGVTGADLQPPPANVYASAIEALRLGGSAEAIICVIAASMDARSGHRVLPSYLDILRQVSRDELELIRALPALGRSAPVSHVNVILPSSQAVVVYRNVLTESMASLCQYKDNIPQYVDNLARLGLVVVRLEEEARGHAYRAMAKFRFVRRFLAQAPEGSRLAMTPSTISITDLGEGLCRACFD